MSAKEHGPRPLVEIESIQSVGTRKAPFYSEVDFLLKGGGNPNVYLYAGPGCWERANDRRVCFGRGSALVLPDRVEPSSLQWPRVDALVVFWPVGPSSYYRRKIELGQSLIRDGVRFVTIENWPDWLNIWRGQVAS